MTKIKLFYSYSHKDKNFRDELENHLITLKDNQLIDEWHDRKIKAGDDWTQEIERNISDSHIILLLFSPDFIASGACKEEVKRALELKEEKGTIFIPIILRECAWQEVGGISNIQALPQCGKPITQWGDKDEAWQSVYLGIKKQVEKMRDKIMPKLKDDFKNELLRNPIGGDRLDKLFVYPDILEINKSEQKLENNEIDSIKLKDITNFKDKYILIEGEEQSGKTSLCNMLYLHYVDIGFYPILVNGKSIVGKADIKNIINEAYNKQYNSTKDYWLVNKEKRILIIDDINESRANNNNYAAFIQSINNSFEYAIIFIDKLSNLSDKSIEHNNFYPFQDYTIKSLGHNKRDRLIKKCIANDEGIEFSIHSKEQVARLDKDTKHINTIIGSNIFPSYPIFIVSAFNIVESVTPQDMRQTSYGHCYHAMITTQLYRANIRPSSMDQYFNFLIELSYFMFKKNKKYISEYELNQFSNEYKNSYIFDKSIIDGLIKANTLINKSATYSFQYVYIYYYFVAKYISDHIDNKDVKKQVNKLMSRIYKKDNSNIIVFITHHTKNNKLLDDILRNTMATFKNFSEANLEKQETKFINDAIERLRSLYTVSENHDVEKQREYNLKEKDKQQHTVEKMEDDIERNEDDLLLIEIRKSAKSMEIIGQIMKNQYGTFTKDRLFELFENGQNVGLRLLKSFINLMNDDSNGLDNLIQEKLLQIAKEKNQELSKEKATLISQQFITRFSYSIIFGWLHKIVDSLGYGKIVSIADSVNNKTNTPASKLINLSIHAWHKKELNIEKLHLLYKEFDNDNNHTAIYILKDIVSRHIYMHKIDYKDKQKIGSLLGLSVQKQVSIQQKIKSN